ncbi:lytic murein transglycosylase [Candidatus Woesearchaeota archaeon]|nr:lytic murein transglycosylase [Candidatus Woesearchaeota archaeon]
MNRRTFLHITTGAVAGSLLGLDALADETGRSHPAYPRKRSGLIKEKEDLVAEINKLIEETCPGKGYDAKQFFDDQRFRFHRSVVRGVERSDANTERWKKKIKDKSEEEIFKLHVDSARRYWANIGIAAFIGIGQRFYDENREFLQQIQSTYKVHANYIAAFLALESKGVDEFGDHDPFNRLASYHFTRRKAELCNTHLPHLVILSYERGLNPHDIPGSTAGAITGSQMLPKIVRDFFISLSEERKNKPDFYHPEDCIVSTANYLAPHWDITHDACHPRYNDCPLKKAILAYNKSTKYALTITKIAESIKL